MRKTFTGKRVGELLFIVALMLAACTAQPPADLVFETNHGSIGIKLYDKTPQHRENILKLAKEGHYEGLLFHRVIRDFMIQAGDPNSRVAEKGALLGAGDVNYTIPAEFVPEYFHKRGALAAARMGDNVNPERASSGSQFYIVQGKTYTDEELSKVETQMAVGRATYWMNMYIKSAINQREAANDSINDTYLNELSTEARQKAEQYMAENPYKLSNEAREIYKTIGGTPLLDGEYTVFGEVLWGMDVVDKIASQKTDEHDRPEENIIIKRVKVGVE